MGRSRVASVSDRMQLAACRIVLTCTATPSIQVVEQLDGACDFENLRIYEFPPPTMQKVAAVLSHARYAVPPALSHLIGQACTEFLAEHEDEVEAHMLKQVLSALRCASQQRAP